jgi:hypothetical protein
MLVHPWAGEFICQRRKIKQCSAPTARNGRSPRYRYRRPRHASASALGLLEEAWGFSPTNNHAPERGFSPEPSAADESFPFSVILSEGGALAAVVEGPRRTQLTSTLRPFSTPMVALVWIPNSSIRTLHLAPSPNQTCHPARSRSRLLRTAQSEDLHLPLPLHLAFAAILAPSMPSLPPRLPVEAWGFSPTKNPAPEKGFSPGPSACPRNPLPFQYLQPPQIIFLVFRPKIACQAPKPPKSLNPNQIDLAF